MAEPERWQVSTDAAEVYESCFVPAIFGAWAGPVADAAGFDLNEGMLEVAARAAPEITWRQGDVASLGEMWRTLAPGASGGGRMASIDHAPGFQILVEIAARQCGREAADVLAAPFVLGDQEVKGSPWHRRSATR